MPKEPERELRICANKQKGRIEIILLADGSPIGSVNFSQEQAEQHTRLLITAIEMLNDGKSKLILPGELRPN
jgi:hypothetical protein